MKRSWIRLLGVFGLIFILFGAVALVFFLNTFLASAAYAEIILGVVLLAVYMINFFGEATRNIWKKREVFYGVVGGFLLLLFLIGVNVIAQSKLGEKKFDLTVNKIHSLDKSSLKILKNLPEPIQIISFVVDPRSKSLLTDLIQKYTYRTNKISFQSIDPDKDPNILKKYDANVGEIVLYNTKTQKVVKLSKNQISEQEMTTAIRRDLSGGEKKIYILQGHGEPDIDDDKTEKGMYLAQLLLKREGYTVAPLELAKTLKVPADANAVIAWGEESPISEPEEMVLENYLSQGGKLVLGLDPLIAPSHDHLMNSGFEELLANYGLKLGRSIIVQVLSFQGRRIRSGTVVGVNYTKNPIVKDMKGNLTQFSVAQPVFESKTYKGKAKRQALVSTGDQTSTETNIKALLKQTSTSKTNGHLGGPYPVGQISELKYSSGKTGKLVVYGDADFGRNNLIQSEYNRDLFLNTLGYLLGQPEGVTIRPKAWKTSTLDITNEQKRGVYFASIFVIPQLIILLGLGIWTLRRNRV